MDSFITADFIVGYVKFGFWCFVCLIPILIIVKFMIGINENQSRKKYGWEEKCVKEKKN